MRRTKIICTLGPASSSSRMVGDLIRAGMNIARINLAHGNHDRHESVLKNLRDQSGKQEKPVAVLMDLQGPKIRVGGMGSHGILLKRGASVVVTTRNVVGDEGTIPVNYDKLHDEVKKGDRILMDDGLIELRVVEIQGQEIRCKVIVGGSLSSHKGVNLPGVKLGVSSLSQKDLEDLDFALRQEVDLIALSFVRSADDIRELREEILHRGSKQQIIAKIEKPEASERIDPIIDAADGIMIARGDLGVEMGPEQVPIIQKDIIRRAIAANKPVITATQMLESMTHNPRPTRAEVSDVANAIFDRCDAIMLSGETSIGNHPVEAMRMMDRIARRTEKHIFNDSNFFRRRKKTTSTFPDTISEAAFFAAQETRAKAIVAFTRSGFTARLISKYRPGAPIFAFTLDQVVLRQLLLSWGVIPLVIPVVQTIDDMIEQVDRRLLDEGYVARGDTILIIAGAPVGGSGDTNMMKLHRIGETW